MKASAIEPRHVTCRTFVHAAHDAFRRDLDRLASAAAANKGGAAHVRVGWDNLKDQIRLHHDMEDRVLWPRVKRVSGRPAARAAVAQAHADRARVATLVERVDAVMRDGGDLLRAVRDLRTAVDAHLRQEEMSTVPLVESVLGPEDLRVVVDEAGSRCEAGAALFVPWVVDGIAPVERSRFLTALPAPLRERNRLTWEPRYRKRRLWRA